jgi:hypothetical protein
MLDIVSPAGIVKPDDERHTDGNARGWKFFVDTINSIWRKGAGDFIACGRYLIEAKDELARDAYSAMLTKLHFNTSTAKKLICIAKNTTLGSHVNLLPPCWSTLYELSQLKEDVLKAALDSGSVHPGMQRKDATALKPKSNNKSTSSSEVQSPDLSTTWNAASADQRREFLDELGRDGLCSAMSSELQMLFRDGIIGITIAGASKSSSWPINATDKLHSAMRIAEQRERYDESIGRLIGALRCIALTAERRGIARSDIVIAEGRPKNRKK